MQRTTTGRSILFLCFVVMLCPIPGAGRPTPLKCTAFRILERIPTYSDLLKQNNIDTYVVSVKAEGKLWQEIMATMDSARSRNLRVVEYYKAPSFLALRFEGSGQSGNLLAGIVDPIHVFRMLLDELAYFKQPDVMQKLKNQSSAACTRATHFIHITLSNRNGAPLLSRYKDYGTETVITEWLHIAARVEAKGNLLRSLDMRKRIKTRSMNSQNNQTRESRSRFEFSYRGWKGNFYPKELQVYRDTALVMQLSASYREVGNRLFPKTKRMKYLLDGQLEEMVLRYGRYELNRPLPHEMNRPAAKGNPEEIRKAGEMARQAEKALLEGRALEAHRWLHSLCRRYPGTPQARQARIFLEGLPR